MVADMNRLEQAARVSMSGFEDPEAPAAAWPQMSHPLLRLVAAVLVAAVVLTLAAQLS